VPPASLLERARRAHAYRILQPSPGASCACCTTHRLELAFRTGRVRWRLRT
jgi:hypothetical protein